MAKRIFDLHENGLILHLPIADTTDGWYVKILLKDTAGQEHQHGEFFIGLTTDKPDFYCPMYLPDNGLTQAIFICDDTDVPNDLFDGILCGRSPSHLPSLYPNLYHESYRQQIHFSPFRGWQNDPNGLVYINNAFHMCFQHNPYGANHAGVNVSWGLAISTDGIHFREYPDAIQPWDSLTHIASGSATLDINNLLGYGNDTVIAVFTALTSRQYKGHQGIGNRGQYLHYSTDGGITFTPIAENPIITAPADTGWRDPKILQLDDGTLCIAVHETYDNQNCVSFYSSSDARHWKFESRTMDLYECPDLFRLNVVETGEKLWVLNGGNGMYRIGRFENYTFQEVENGQYMDYGNRTYAGQTWNCTFGEDVRYHISWLLDDCFPWEYNAACPHKLGFACGMTLLCQFTLHKTPLGFRLFRNPLPTLDSLRDKTTHHSTFEIHENKPVTLPFSIPGDCLLTLDAKAPVDINIGTCQFKYNPVTKVIRFFQGKEYKLTSDDTILKLRIITDTRSVEIFVNGEISATFGPCGDDRTIRIRSENTVGTGESYTLRSIWE